MTAPEVQAQVARAQRCLANGYPPVPILRPDAPAVIEKNGKRVPQSPGKQPHNSLWADKEHSVYAATAATVDRWARLPNIADHPGQGIACGRVAAPDIDVYDPMLADAIEAAAVEDLGATPLRRVGQAPKTLLVYGVDGDEPLHKVQTPELFKGDLKAKVEVLGQGFQFVSHGRHPITERPYTWGEATPETTPLAALPTITQEQAAAFVKKAERMLREAGYQTRAEIEAEATAGTGKTHAGNGAAAPAPAGTPSRGNLVGHFDFNAERTDPFKRVNDEAMHRLDEWVPELFPRVKHSTNGAWRVTSAELGRDLEEDLSISPLGIVDYGVHDQGDRRQGKRSPIDLVMEHGGAPDATQAARWLAERLGMPFEIGRANGKAGADGAAGEAQPEPAPAGLLVEPIRTINFADLVGRTPSPRRFIVEQWLPAGCVTSLYGQGGVGKSLLAQQIASCVATGRDLFGNPVERGPVLGLFAEDDDEELWRRQVRINDWLAVRMDELGNLHPQGRAGLENTLALYPPKGLPQVQPLFERIREKAAELRPALVILDNAAQIFGGDENNRYQVSHFVNLLGGLARELDCAVLLLGHPAKVEGSGYSGSTAWDASVRSRLLLQRKAGEGDEDGLLQLKRVKSNYAKLDDLTLRYVDGTFRAVAPEAMTMADKIDAEAKAGAARTAFIKALDELSAQGRSVSHANRASNYAPKFMMKVGLVSQHTLAELEEAMNHLLNEGFLVANKIIGLGKDRHSITGLGRASDIEAPAEEGPPEPGSDGERSEAEGPEPDDVRDGLRDGCHHD